MTVHHWYIEHQRVVFRKNVHWMGVRALKLPLDAWIYQEIIYETQPEVILEIGSKYGGSAQFFANMLDLLGKGGRVLTLDIDHSIFGCKHPAVTAITGDSGSPETIGRVHEEVRGRRVLLIHDGDHSAPAVLRDLRAYWDLVPLDGYIIVEDGVQDLFEVGDGIGSSTPGPLAATREFLRENSHFEADRTRERYTITYNPEGFLRRVR